jgi:DNA-binding CsgD family transcriptional regulator
MYDPSNIHYILADMGRHIDARGAVFMTFGAHDQTLIVRDLVTFGGAQNWAGLRHTQPPPNSDADCSDFALSFRKDQWCLRAPHSRHRNAFSWLEDDIRSERRWRSTGVFQKLYGANQFRHQLRAILVADERIVGWVAFFWSSINCYHRAEEYLNGRMPEFLEAAQRLRVPMSSRRFLLSNARLIGEEASEGHELEISETTLDAIVRKVERRRKSFAVDGLSATVCPMNTDFGETFLLKVSTLPDPEVDPVHALTSQQLAIARDVANGLSNREIAERIDASVDTVKYHLKNIFSVIEVSSRVGLTQVMWCSPVMHSA